MTHTKKEMEMIREVLKDECNQLKVIDKICEKEQKETFKTFITMHEQAILMAIERNLNIGVTKAIEANNFLSNMRDTIITAKQLHDEEIEQRKIDTKELGMFLITNFPENSKLKKYDGLTICQEAIEIIKELQYKYDSYVKVSENQIKELQAEIIEFKSNESFNESHK